MIEESNQLHQLDALRNLAGMLDSARHGEKSKIKADFAKSHLMSMGTLHRKLKAVGWVSGRKRRCDAGSTSQDEKALIEIGTMLKEGLRKNGKATMHITTARSILAQNGRDLAVSNSQLAKLLRQINMDAKSQKRPASCNALVSLHPNHMHQADPSLCLLYYTPNGRQHVLHDDEIYKNKPDWVEKVGNLKCWRYVLTDHFSASIIVQYKAAGGETQANMYEFLLYCWRKVKGRVFHGVPTILYTDKGTAHTAGGMQNALKSLGVQFEAHKAHNAKATGSVEGAQNIVETQLESRLKYEPVASVEELNERAEQWYKAWNSNAIPDYDSRLKRRGLSEPVARYGIWQVIREHQLRLLPEMDLCRYLMVNDPVEKTVSQYNEVSFKYPGDKRTTHWDVGHIPGIGNGSTVVVQPLIYGDKQILVTVSDYQGNEQAYEASPAEFDPVSGQKLGGPVVGEEYKAVKDSDVVKAGKVMDRVAYPDMTEDEIEKQRKKNAAPLGGLDALSHLEHAKGPDYMDRKGTQVHVPDPVRVELPKLSGDELHVALFNQYQMSLSRAQELLIERWYPEGVTEGELADLVAQLNTDQSGGLRVVK